MASRESRIRARREDGVIVVEFVDRNLLDEGNIQVIGEELEDLVCTTESPVLVISFVNVDHLSSAAMGTLIKINNTIRGRNGRLAICRLDPQIYEVFVITRLNKLLNFFESEEEAREYLTTRSGMEPTTLRGTLRRVERETWLEGDQDKNFSIPTRYEWRQIADGSRVTVSGVVLPRRIVPVHRRESIRMAAEGGREVFVLESAELVSVDSPPPAQA